jgi:hypothetical protein
VLVRRTGLPRWEGKEKTHQCRGHVRGWVAVFWREGNSGGKVFSSEAYDQFIPPPVLFLHVYVMTDVL